MFEREELRHTFVVGAQELVVDVMLDRDPVDLPEPMPREELHLEGETEHSSYADVACAHEQLLEQEMADSLALDRRINGERADFGEVLPHHV